MEVTPLDTRGVYVSSGEGIGAKPHGRDTSPKTASAAEAYASSEATNKVLPMKYPLNVVSQRVAANLLRVVPGLSPEAAQKIADQLTAEPESARKAAASDTLIEAALGSNVDFTA